jgi:hypothetical protein
MTYAFIITFPPSIYFLQLSHAPPVFEKEIAIYTPETITPAKRPLTALCPNKNPKTRGENTTKSPGGSISRSEETVDI